MENMIHGRHRLFTHCFRFMHHRQEALFLHTFRVFIPSVSSQILKLKIKKSGGWKQLLRLGSTLRSQLTGMTTKATINCICLFTILQISVLVDLLTPVIIQNVASGSVASLPATPEFPVAGAAVWC